MEHNPLRVVDCPKIRTNWQGAEIAQCDVQGQRLSSEDSMIGVIAMIAQIISSQPRLSPEQAIAVLQADQLSADVTGKRLSPWPDGPQVMVMPTSPTAGPFGEFPPFRWYPPVGLPFQYWNGGRSIRYRAGLLPLGAIDARFLPFDQATAFFVDPLSIGHGNPHNVRSRSQKGKRR